MTHLLRPLLIVLTLIVCSPARAQRPPKDELESSVDRGLAFLHQMQEKDGCWSFRGEKNVAMSSLSLLAFLSAGHVPGEGLYGDVVDEGLRWVLAQQQPDGLITLDQDLGLYHHGIATLLLTQVVGMTDAVQSAVVRTKLEKAVAVILKGQRTEANPSLGGWRYRIDSNDADLSVTGWQIMALRGARNLGCDVPAEAMKNALGFVERCRDPIGGGYGYLPGFAPTAGCTGTALLIVELSGKNGHRSRDSLQAGSFLLKTPLEPSEAHFLYATYYSSQGMFQLGKNYWSAFRPTLHKQLLPRQERGGAWQDSAQNGSIYATSMAILSLTVEYRLLPIYQRDEK